MYANHNNNGRADEQWPYGDCGKVHTLVYDLQGMRRFSEADASETIENIKEMFPRLQVHNDVCSQHSHIKHHNSVLHVCKR